MATIDLIPPIVDNAVRLYGTYTELRLVSPTIHGFGFSDNGDWYTTSDSKTDIDERIGADGGFDIDTDWRTSLAVSVSGWYRGPDRKSVRAARNTIKKAVAQGKMIVLRFTDEDEVTERTLSVRSFVPSDPRGGLSFTFELDMVAADPLLYGSAVTYPPLDIPTSGGGLLWPLGTTPTAYWDFGADGTSGRQEVTNDGTAEAFPFIQVTGGLSGGFVIADITSGQQVIFLREIPVGSTVTINQRTGQALLNGQNDVSGNIVSWDFFAIPAESSHVLQFSPIGTVTGTPQATVTLQSAYL